jgi:transposase
MTQIENQSNKMSDKPSRLKFPSEYKLRILQEIDSRKDDRGATGEILRREDLFASQIYSWRAALKNVIDHGIPEKKRGPKTNPKLLLEKENQKLERKNSKLADENKFLRRIIEAQKKLRRCIRRNP